MDSGIIPPADQSEPSICWTTVSRVSGYIPRDITPLDYATSYESAICSVPDSAELQNSQVTNAFKNHNYIKSSFLGKHIQIHWNPAQVWLLSVLIKMCARAWLIPCLYGNHGNLLNSAVPDHAEFDSGCVFRAEIFERFMEEKNGGLPLYFSMSIVVRTEILFLDVIGIKILS